MDCMRNQFRQDVVLDGRFKTVAPLNHGSFGMVFKARDMVTGEYVALKCITKTSAANFCPSSMSIDDRSEELTIHQRIGYHPNIVNLIHSFETEHHIYLVLEYCPNGDLYEAIRLGKGPLETEHVRDFMLQLVDAVQFIHSKGLYHRDIKPENIFLTKSGSMKLGDFGLATTEKWSYESAVGSDRYMAPEQFDTSANGYSPAEADTWAIGICLLNVLFSRNPFAVPTDSDPLYRDFLVDRQSLFDVFPNMSQDTFQILTQCLAIEPECRSLSGVRDALKRVVSFTTDDELLDEFCNGNVVTATANREPLRTPSISSPQMDQGGAFPWQKALAGFSQLPRQLSAIPDETPSEDLFPDSERSSGEWSSYKRDSSSIASFVDSGLGLSLKSSMDIPRTQSITATRSRPVPISGSLPASAPRPIPSMGSVFGKKNDTVSKSWSDMYEEEEEENIFQGGNGLLAKVRSRESMFSGRSTPRPVPRAGLSEVKNPATVHNSRDPSPAMRAAVDDSISEQTGFIFEDHHPTPSTPRYTPPKRSMADMTDRWAALGNRRRGTDKPSADKAPAERLQKSKSQGRKRTRTGSWRRDNNTGGWSRQNNEPSNNHHMNGVWERGKDWSLSKDWRQHQSPLKHFSSSVQLRTGRSLARDENDDLGADIEWVGGWHDLHL